MGDSRIDGAEEEHGRGAGLYRRRHGGAQPVRAHRRASGGASASRHHRVRVQVRRRGVCGGEGGWRHRDGRAKLDRGAHHAARAQVNRRRRLLSCHRFVADLAKPADFQSMNSANDEIMPR
ncbi:hypothetical protein ebA4894 [Aromatoleum aromaticum EbN1]|uniref:Uncharacterized protein n=1 Tax=Aromatoleum aromaticum (strain DSM 19018 / LMG 30748 / EbN1) TaxID=76114 RepID=Q5P1A4_AROAE|nr:hypothetical protein ebA4894 [Aromatoleum aromaticum EbN1]